MIDLFEAFVLELQFRNDPIPDKGDQQLIDPLSQLDFVRIGSHADVNRPAGTTQIRILLPIDDEDDRFGAVVDPGGESTEILAHPYDRKFTLVQNFVYLHIRILPHQCLVDDTDIAVRLLKVSTLDDIDPQRTENFPIGRKHGIVVLIFAIPPSPFHPIV